jgi:hypothetical protein
MTLARSGLPGQRVGQSPDDVGQEVARVLHPLPGGVTVPPPVGFEVGFVGPDGRQVRMGLDEAATVRLEAVAPVRAFPSFKRQRYVPGLWWSATTRRHVGYESWAARGRPTHRTTLRAARTAARRSSTSGTPATRPRRSGTPSPIGSTRTAGARRPCLPRPTQTRASSAPAPRTDQAGRRGTSRRSARWLSWTRAGGTTMLFHRHLPGHGPRLVTRPPPPGPVRLLRHRN